MKKLDADRLNAFPMATWASHFEGHSLPTLPYFLPKRVQGRRTNGSTRTTVLFKLVDKSNVLCSL